MKSSGFFFGKIWKAPPNFFGWCFQGKFSKRKIKIFMAKSFIFELFWKELLGFSYFYWPVEQGRLKLYQIHKKSHSKVLTWNRKRDSWVFLNLKFPPHTLHLIKGDLRRLCKEFKPKSFLYVKAKEEWKTSQLGWVLQSGWKRWIKARLMCCLSSPPLRHKYPKR